MGAIDDIVAQLVGRPSGSMGNMGNMVAPPMDQYSQGAAPMPEVDAAAMQPETFANPAVRHIIDTLATLPKRAVDAAKISAAHNYGPGPDSMSDSDAPFVDPLPAAAAETAMTVMGGSGVVPAEANALRSGLSGPIFHGSERPNIQFINPSQRGPLGPGVYATPSESLARNYAGDAGTVYKVPSDDLDIFNGAGHRTDAEYHGYKDDMQRLLDAVPADKRAAVGEMTSKLYSGDGYPLYQRLRNLYGSDEGAQGLFKDAGFHGLSGQVDGHEVLIFGPQSRPSGGGQ